MQKADLIKKQSLEKEHMISMYKQLGRNLPSKMMKTEYLEMSGVSGSLLVTSSDALHLTMDEKHEMSTLN